MTDQASLEAALRQARVLIDKYDRTAAQKSSLLAEDFKRKGNALLNSGQPEAALELYNKVSDYLISNLIQHNIN